MRCHFTEGVKALDLPDHVIKQIVSATVEKRAYGDDPKLRALVSGNFYYQPLDILKPDGDKASLVVCLYDKTQKGQKKSAHNYKKGDSSIHLRSEWDFKANPLDEPPKRNTRSTRQERRSRKLDGFRQMAQKQKEAKKRQDAGYEAQAKENYAAADRQNARVWTPAQLKACEDMKAQVEENRRKGESAVVMIVPTEFPEWMTFEEIKKAVGLDDTNSFDPSSDFIKHKSPDKPPNANKPTADNGWEGLTGDLFENDGRNAIAVPSEGTPNSIKFTVGPSHTVSVDGVDCAWTDVVVHAATVIGPGGAKKRGKETNCRVNSEIVKPPFWRLADCLLSAWFRADKIPFNKDPSMMQFEGRDFPPKPHANSEQFVFGRIDKGSTKVVMIDTLERVERVRKATS